MDIAQDNVIGIVGGMGPHAGLALFDAILHNTRAVIDQQHLSVILMSMPKHIGDRTAFLEGKGDVNPAFSIASIIERLEAAGAKIVGLACNTSYSPEIYSEILKALDRRDSRVKLVNMPLETCRYIKQQYPSICRVGVMTTNGSYKSEVYKKPLLDLGFDVVLPDREFQDSIIHKMIYDPVFGIKSSPDDITQEAMVLWQSALQFFIKENTQAVILGCTELSLMHAKENINGMVIIDSTEVLAQSMVRDAMVGTEALFF